MSIDYGETVIQAAEEIEVALRALTQELQRLRKTHDHMLNTLQELVLVLNNRI